MENGVAIICLPTRELAAQVAGIASVLAPRGMVKLVPRPMNLMSLWKTEVDRGEEYEYFENEGNDEELNSSSGRTYKPRILVGSAKSISLRLFGDKKMPASPTSKPEGKSLLSNTRWFVLDEVDRLLSIKKSRTDKSFKRHEKPAAMLAAAVARLTKGRVQVIAASATVGRPIRRELSRAFRKNVGPLDNTDVVTNTSNSKRGMNNYYLHLPQKIDVDMHYENASGQVRHSQCGNSGMSVCPAAAKSKVPIQLGRLQLCNECTLQLKRANMGTQIAKPPTKKRRVHALPLNPPSVPPQPPADLPDVDSLTNVPLNVIPEKDHTSGQGQENFKLTRVILIPTGGRRPVGYKYPPSDVEEKAIAEALGSIRYITYSKRYDDTPSNKLGRGFDEKGKKRVEDLITYECGTVGCGSKLKVSRYYGFILIYKNFDETTGQIIQHENHQLTKEEQKNLRRMISGLPPSQEPSRYSSTALTDAQTEFIKEKCMHLVAKSDYKSIASEMMQSPDCHVTDEQLSDQDKLVQRIRTYITNSRVRGDDRFKRAD